MRIIAFAYFPLILRRKAKKFQMNFSNQSSLLLSKKYCYTDGLQYDQNICRKDSIKFLNLKSYIMEDRYCPKQPFNMLAQMTF